MLLLAGAAVWKFAHVLTAVQAAYDWLAGRGPAGAMAAVVLVPYAGIAELARYPSWVNAIVTFGLVGLIAYAASLVRRRWSLTPGEIDSIVYEAGGRPDLLKRYPQWMAELYNSDDHLRDDGNDAEPASEGNASGAELPALSLPWGYNAGLAPEELLFRPYKPLNLLQSLRRSLYPYVLALAAVALTAVEHESSKFAQDIHRLQLLLAILLIVIIAALGGSGGRTQWASYADRFAPANWRRAAWTKLRYQAGEVVLLDTLAALLLVVTSGASFAWILPTLLVLCLLRVAGFLVWRLSQLTRARNGKLFPAVSLGLLLAVAGFLVYLVGSSVWMPRDLPTIFTRGLMLLGAFAAAADVFLLIIVTVSDRVWSPQIVSGTEGAGEYQDADTEF